MLTLVVHGASGLPKMDTMAGMIKVAGDPYLVARLGASVAELDCVAEVRVALSFLSLVVAGSHGGRLLLLVVGFLGSWVLGLATPALSNALRAQVTCPRVERNILSRGHIPPSCVVPAVF